MIKLHEKFITNTYGKKAGVILSMKDYNKVISILEEYEDIKDFDERIQNPEWISFDKFKKNLDV